MCNISKELIRFSIAVLTLFCSLKSFAQSDPVYVGLLRGDSIQVDKKTIVQDTVFFNPQVNAPVAFTSLVQNVVSLRINEYSNRTLPDSFAATVKVRINFIDKNNLTDSITEKVLSINYFKNKPYQNKSVFTFKDAYWVQVKVLEVTATHAALSSILPVLDLENRLIINRDYTINCVNDAVKSVSKDLNSISEYGELKVYWPLNRVSEEYDLEWTFVDKSALDAGRYHLSGQINPQLLFRHNATRITTKNDHYFIPLLYDGEGSLFYRVRGVQTNASGEVVNTNWSSDFVSQGGLGRHDFTGHERKLNWQATTSFAEEGKRKSVVQYFDGSLRGRQTVTRDNTTKTTIVAETLYDKQGRPAIQVMPAPTISKLLGYTPNFNVADINSRPYDQGVYDTLLTAYCENGADSMSVVSGASNYYSPLNPKVDSSFHRFIPNANGYAFSQTQYTQDNTGRIYRQGGVGKEFQIGSGHETKYYYETPAQRELDALFGTEVGDQSHYQKNLVRDANGQYSVSYVDMHGRTIATALTGKSPDSLEALSSYQAYTNQSFQMLNPSNNLLKGNSIEFSQSLVMTKDDSVWFRYSVGKESLTLKDCQERNICYDCLYDLTITIAGDCENQVSGATQKEIKLKNFPAFRVDTVCGLATPVDTLLRTFLKEGNYTVSKVLSISEEGLSYLRDSVYLSRNTCESYEDILTTQRSLIASVMNCTETEENRPSFFIYRDQMLVDLTPLVGQYADTSFSDPDKTHCFSIFEKENGEIYRYQRIKETFLNEEGQRDLVVNNAGILVVPQKLTPEEFIASYKESWGAALLPLHPEYALLQKYEQLQESLTWDDGFANTNTYQEAYTKGYLNPFGPTTTEPATRFPSSSTGRDPLFDYSFLGSAVDALRDSLLKFRPNTADNDNQFLTVWGLATISAKCTDPNDNACAIKWNKKENVFNSDSLCAGELDMAWRSFKSIYVEKKREWIYKYIRAQTGMSYPVNNCQQVFEDRDAVLNAAGLSGDLSQMMTTSAAKAGEFYATNCKSYQGYWREQLSACYSAQEVEVMIGYLTKVCSEGADETHPLGSSSVRPNSTYQFESFEEVFQHVNDSLGKASTINCNAFIIGKPLPYSKTTSLIQKPYYSKPDSCECAKINSYYSSYTQSSGYADFSDYVSKRLGTAISQGTLDSLRGLCNGTITCKYVSNQLYLPPVFQCGVEGVCVDCSVVNEGFAAFKQQFPGSIPTLSEENSTQEEINEVFASFMNSRYGFQKTSSEYLLFIDSCTSAGYGGNASANAADSMGQLIRDFQAYYKAGNNGQVAKGYRISAGAIEMIKAANAIYAGLQNSQALPAGYGYANYSNSFDAKLGSVVRMTANNIHAVVPMPLQYTQTFQSYVELQNNTIAENDFINGFASPQQLNTKYYATVINNGGNCFQQMWGRRYGYGEYAYYGLSTPIAKYLPTYATENHVFTYAFYTIPFTVTTPTAFSQFYHGSVLNNGAYSQYVINNNVVKEIKEVSLDTTFFDPNDGDCVTATPKGIKVKLALMDNTEQIAYMFATYNCGGYMQYKEQVNSNLYSENCSVAFKNFYNQQKGTNYSFAQIDSIYQSLFGKALNPCDSNASINCSSLKSIVQEYYTKYVKPGNRIVELDMRTFAGNKTPWEGPKGVFNVNGQLIGNTTSGTVHQINQSFSQIWNSDPVNQAVGVLTSLSNGRFQLQLNPGQEAPCDGIVGMRYYQIDNYHSELDAIYCGVGCYVDFGDGKRARVKSIYSDSSTTLEGPFYGYGGAGGRSSFEYAARYHVRHQYGSEGKRTVTLYHSEKGVFGVDNRGPSGESVNKMKNLRGYMPQETKYFIFHSTQDSTLTRSDSIYNFSQVTTIEKVSLANGTTNNSQGPKYYRFKSFANNKGLKEIWLDDNYYPPGQAFDTSFPKLNVNFKQLNFLRIGGTVGVFTDSINFRVPSLRAVQIIGELTPKQIDTVIIQVAATNETNGILRFDFLSTQRTSASDAAVNSLISKNWSLWGAGLNTTNTENSYTTSQDHDTVYVTNGVTEYVNINLGTNYSPRELQSAYRNICGDSLMFCNLPRPFNPDLVLCGKNEPLNKFITNVQDPLCSDTLIFAINKAVELHRIYKDSLINSFNEAYTKKCLAVGVLENLTVTKPVSEYHYTLYYYDQAGNLVKTVAPSGVHPNRDTVWLNEVVQKRKLKQTQVPSHSMATVYRYNSLNQVVSQYTPDAGKSEFWYDKLGRLAVSQNAKQKPGNNYSYTKYDKLGRITEVGQKSHTTQMSQAISRNSKELSWWLYYKVDQTAHKLRMVTFTVYDNISRMKEYYGGSGVTPFVQKKHTLRNRVSSSMYFDELSYIINISGGDTTYGERTHTAHSYVDYSYDIHGNVDGILNIFNSAPMTLHGNNRFKYTKYKYDLISGKVNEVHYQPTKADEFYHRYEYDAENRITDVYSTDVVALLGQRDLEEHEAFYQYYKHGPLARSVVGHQQVQGVDYAYTLQGWLKGVNSTALSQDIDMGEDGKVGGANAGVARDAYGFNLNYFTGEYASIKGLTPFPGHTAYMPSGAYKALYNGNISSMAVNIGQFNQPQLYNYKYDQLNRVVAMDVYRGLSTTNNNWNNSFGIVGDYKERVSYDGNGNILNYLRQGFGTNLNMDSLTYNYYAGTNKLNHVRDRINNTTSHSTNYTEDLEDQALNNYEYDAIGNLTKDVKEGITAINWNVYGKISSITRNGNTISYTYDPQGNRISKLVNGKYTVYMRDAQSNVMAVYERGSDGVLKLKEHHLYGSSRLGVVQRDLNVDLNKATPVNVNLLGATYLYSQERGQKMYELSNHLGNVLVTVSDKKIGVPLASNSSLIDYYKADVVSAQDYYPFGMLQPGRKTSFGLYRYGFNGKENDNEVKGEGAQQDYGFRIYDPRAGRFLSVDPLTKAYPELTPYQFSSNNPIQNVDLDGLEGADYRGRITNATEDQRKDYPVWSFFRDLSADLLNNLTPAGAIDNAIATYQDPKASTLEKISSSLDVLTAPGLPGKFGRGKMSTSPDVPLNISPEKPVISKGNQNVTAEGTTKQALLANNDNPKALPPSTSKVPAAKEKLENAAKGSQGKGTFIVSETGTTVSTSQSRMMETFKEAGFPSWPTQSPGIGFTLPNGNKVRAMQPSGTAPLRSSFTNAKDQPVNIDGKTVNPPKGTTNTKQYVRERTHVTQTQ